MLITRTIDPADLDIITEWWYQEWKSEYMTYGYDTIQKVREDIHQRIRDSRMTVFVAREGSLIMSVAALIIQRDPAIPYAHTWLSNVYTRPEYRGEGYGTQVVRELVSFAIGLAHETLLFLRCEGALVGWYTELGFHKHSQSGDVVTMRIPLGMVSSLHGTIL